MKGVDDLQAFDLLFLEQHASDYSEAIRICAVLLEQKGYVKETFFEACLDRETRFPTGLPVHGGLAIPHTDKIHVFKSCLCLLRLPEPVGFGRIDQPTDTVRVKFVVCIAVGDFGDYNSVLARLVTAFQDVDFVEELGQGTETEALRIFKERLTEPS